MAQKILVVYYSHSSNTYKIAQYIQTITKGKLLEIQPTEPYPKNYNATVERAKKEVYGGQECPINHIADNLASYDTIIVGTPNWCSTVASPIKTFLIENSFVGKTILPFYTHGGGGGGNIAKDITSLCPGAIVLNCFGVSGSGSSSTNNAIMNWLQNAGIIE